MTSIAELSVKVTTSGVSATERELDRLGKASDKAAEKVGKGLPDAVKSASAQLAALQRPLTVATGALAAFGAVGVAYSIKRWRDTFQDLTRTLRSSRELGIAAEDLSRLEFAAKASDVAVGDLAGGMRNLSRYMAEAAKGGKEQSGLFKQLGVASVAADGALRPLHAVMRDVAEQVSKIEDPTTRAAVAMKLFGEQGGKLMPLLDEGAAGMDRMARKADELGYTFRGDMQVGAREITRQMDELKLSMDAMWRQSLTQLLPKLQDLASLLNSSEFREGFNTIVTGATTAVEALAKFAATTASVTKFMGEEFAFRIHGPSVDDVVRTGDELARVQKRIDTLRKGGVASLFNPDQAFVRDAQQRKGINATAFRAGSRDEELEFLEKYQEKLRAGLDLSEELRASAARIAKDAAAPLGGVNIDWSALGGGGAAAKAPRQRKDNSIRDALEEQRRVMEQQDRWRDQMLDMRAQMEGPLAEVMRQYEKQVGSLDAAFARGEVTLATYAESHDLLAKSRDRDAEAINRQLTPVQQLLASLDMENKMLAANREEQLRLAAARLAGADATAIQVEEVRKSLELNEHLREAQNNWRELSGNIAQSLQGIIDWSKSAKDGILGFFDSLNSQILRNITQDWADSLTDMLKGFGKASGGGGGGGFNWASLLSAFGFASGGYTGDGPRGRAAGVVHGQEYVLNAATTRRLGRSSLDALNRGATLGAPHYQAPVLNFAVQGSVDQRSASAIAAATGRTVRDAMARR